MCSDELCISSDLHNKPDENNNVGTGIGVDEKSVLEKSSTFDGRPEWVQSCYVKKVKGIVKEFSKAKDYFPVTTFNVCNSHENKNR
uniref:Uncharacterized protein n=1 Tax=Panagrolaimus superbus TaxID=310955 RepID=A0A914YS49_9BILA